MDYFYDNCMVIFFLKLKSLVSFDYAWKKVAVNFSKEKKKINKFKTGVSMKINFSNNKKKKTQQ